MGHSYEESKKKAFKIIGILAVITLVEVALALLGKGYIIPGLHAPGWMMGAIMIVFSVIKAYLIIYEFMHMKYEVPSLVKSVLLPMALLIWGVIAFLWEGSAWMQNRSKIENKNNEVRYEEATTVGMIYHISAEDM